MFLKNIEIDAGARYVENNMIFNVPLYAIAIWKLSPLQLYWDLNVMRKNALTSGIRCIKKRNMFENSLPIESAAFAHSALFYHDNGTLLTNLSCAFPNARRDWIFFVLREACTAIRFCSFKGCGKQVMLLAKTLLKTMVFFTQQEDEFGKAAPANGFLSAMALHPMFRLLDAEIEHTFRGGPSYLKTSVFRVEQKSFSTSSCLSLMRFSLHYKVYGQVNGHQCCSSQFLSELINLPSLFVTGSVTAPDKKTETLQSRCLQRLIAGPQFVWSDKMLYFVQEFQYVIEINDIKMISTVTECRMAMTSSALSQLNTTGRPPFAALTVQFAPYIWSLYVKGMSMPR